MDYQSAVFKMRKYWNDSAQTYDERHDLYDENHWQNVLSGLVGSNKEATILDVATGTGLIANYLASAGYENVVGACHKKISKKRQ